MVVTLSPFKANLAISDVLLPIAPFTETSGSFVNAEGRVQGFHAVVKPLGETRPAWKVLRVLANLLGVPGFDFESSTDVLASRAAAAHRWPAHAGRHVGERARRPPRPARPLPAHRGPPHLPARRHRAPCPSLQLTADAGAPRRWLVVKEVRGMIDQIYGSATGLIARRLVDRGRMAGHLDPDQDCRWWSRR